MEDEERQKKLEAGKAKLAEYRQRKAHADSQKKQKKKKKKKPVEDSEGDSQREVELDPDQSEVVEEVSGAGQHGAQEGSKDPPTTEFTFARTVRSGETVKHDQTYTIEPESEVSTTAEDCSSEEEVEALHQVSKGGRKQDMEDALAAKTLAVEELSRELEEIRAAFGTEGVQQLQDFEAALKQRDGIITQLTSNLQQAREEKDEIMKEFLELTEQSQKLQIQFQQLQAGETLRNTSHSSTAADLLQARQQLIQHQQQIEEVNVEVKKQQELISKLQHELRETEMSGRRSEESFAQRIKEKDLLITEKEKVILGLEQSLAELRAVEASFAQTLKEKNQVISEQTVIIKEHELSLTLLREELTRVGQTMDESLRHQSDEKDLIIAQKERVLSERDCSLTQLKDELAASEKRLLDLQQQVSVKESELKRCMDELEDAKSDLRSSKSEIESVKLELEKERTEFESCKGELAASRQKERMSSNEIMQLMGTVEDLQKRCHQGSLSESDAVQKMQEDTKRKLELLRAELDEMYGQQIVEMKQELNLRHVAEREQMMKQHRTELEFLRAQQLSQSSAAEVETLNVKIRELQVTLEQSQKLHNTTSHELSKATQEKLNLQAKVEDLLRDLRSAKDKVEQVSNSLSSQESQEGELLRLQEIIESLKSELVDSQEAAQEAEVKHESEITNYKIKLEMLEREKDAVLDRMAESQEAELERLRTQLLFSHEEELTNLREELQRENFQNTENLVNETALKHEKKLEEQRASYEAKMRLLQKEKTSFATEKDELLHQINGLKEDLKLALQNSKADELVQQLQELQVELEELRKGGEDRARMEKEIQTVRKKTTELENKMKEKEKSWKSEKEKLTERNNTLKEELDSKLTQIESLTAESSGMQKQVSELSVQIEKQRTTFSFAEKNFEVNYQELKEEYRCLIEAKTQLEERMLRQTLEFEVKISGFQSQIRELEESGKTQDPNSDKLEQTVVEKDSTELMEKLNVTLSEKESLSGRLSEVTEKLMVTERKVEELEEERKRMIEEKAEVLARNESMKNKLEKENTPVKGKDAQRKFQQEQQAVEPICCFEDHHLQIQSFQEEIKTLQSLLQAAESERDGIRKSLELQRLSQSASPAAAAAAVITAQSTGEGPVEGQSSPQKSTASGGSSRRRRRQRSKQERKAGSVLSDCREETQREEEAEDERATSAAEPEMQPQMQSQVMSCSPKRAGTEDSTDGYQGDAGRDFISKQVSRHGTGHRGDPAVCQSAEEEEETTEHGECRLQMEAQRISLSQIHAAQLELLQEETDVRTKSLQLKLQTLKDHADKEEHKFKYHDMSRAVSEECSEIIQCFRQIFGEEYLEGLDSRLSSSVERPETSESTSVLPQARELYRGLQQVQERIEQEHHRLSQLQALLREDGNKIVKLQTAYNELKSSSEREISDLRVQVSSLNTSTSKDVLEGAASSSTSWTEETQRLKAAEQEKQLQLEESHRQEVERLRAHYRQQATETEERFLTEILLLQQRLTEVTGTEIHFSISESILPTAEGHSEEPPKDQAEEGRSQGGADLRWPGRPVGLTAQLQALRKALYHKYVQEVAALKEQHSRELRGLQEEKEEERKREQCPREEGEKEQGVFGVNGSGSTIESLGAAVLEERQEWQRVEEEVAKAIVQMSVEFAQQTELARINKRACQTSTSMQTQLQVEQLEEEEEEEEEERENEEEQTPVCSPSWLHDAEKERLERELKERNAEIRKLREELQKTKPGRQQTLKKPDEDRGEVEEEEDPGGTGRKKRASGSRFPSRGDGESSEKDPERNILRAANEKLSQVLVDVLKTTAAAEETMSLHMKSLRDASSGGQQASPPLSSTQRTNRPQAAGLSMESCSESSAEDASLWFREMEADEGLELSQQIIDSLMLGAGTQLENEEHLMGISSRLQTALKKMLMAITDTTNKLEHAKVTQTELMRESFRHNQEMNVLLQKQEELQERLLEEGRAREQLALELHRAEGLIDGYTGERAALEEQLRQKQELQLSLEQELQVTGSRLQELEQERLQMQEERELLARQQDAMKEHAGPRELRLVEAAMVAAPEADLLEETEKLMKEKVEVQRQAEKENADLLKQVRLLEVELEEQVNKVIELDQARRTESGDLQQQIQALEKQLEKNRRFLDEQAVDREHERDFFQQEINKLEQQLKNPQKVQAGSEQRNREVEQLTSQLKEKADWCSELLLSSEQLRRELGERDEEIDKLESRIRELEQALLASAESLEKVEQKKQHASITEARQSTLEAQLQTEREALERKEKEICNLEEQLEQFKEELENKSEEVQQLHMQLEIQRKEISSQQEYLETREGMMKVMEEKDREIALLNEQISKLQHMEAASDNKELDQRDDLIRDLESQVECLRSEQERLKRNNEEELDQLNAVIDRLQQELANIEQKSAAEEDEEVKTEADSTSWGPNKEEYDEMKQRMDLATKELNTLKAEHSKLLKTYLSLKESAAALAESEKQESSEGELEEALREKTAGLVVFQAQVQALEQSATTRVEELDLRIRELEDVADEKERELSRCHLLVEQAQSHADGLQERVSHLEKNLREKVADMLLCQATLEASQQTQDSKENQDQERQAEPHTFDFGDFGIPKMDFSGIGQARQAPTGKVVHLTQRLRELEVGLNGMQKDQELQKQLLSSSEEEVLEYERRLSVLMELLSQMKAKTPQRTSPTVKTSSADEQPSASEVLQELQDVRAEASATKEQLDSFKESCSRLQEELQEKTLTVERLQDQVQKLSSGDREDTRVSEFKQELKEAQNEAAATKEELNSCKESLEKMQELLQEREMTIAHLKAELFQVKADEDSANMAEQLQELDHVRKEAASTKEELSSFMQQNKKLQEEVQARDVSVSELKDELEEVRKSVDTTKEELSSYKQHNEKLQEELQVREASISQLKDELQEVRTALMKTADPGPLSPSVSLSSQPLLSASSSSSSSTAQPKRKGGKQPAGKGTTTKDKQALSRKSSGNSSQSSNKSHSSRLNSSSEQQQVDVTHSSTQTDPLRVIDFGTEGESATKEQVEEVIGEFQEKIVQMQELHAAEILDMEARQMTESESLRRDAQAAEDECKALKAVIEKLRATEAPSSRQERHTHQFKDGYTSDSSSDYSHRTGFDVPSLQQEFRTTPEGARREPDDPLPDRIKTLLREVHQEGMQVLSLSELPLSEPGSQFNIQGWMKERDALLATVESLKGLITQMQTHRDTQTSGGVDWRGELLDAVQQVFTRERGVLKSALYSQLDLLDTNDAIVHLNQLERRLAEQDLQHREAMSSLHSADRSSLLSEVQQLRGQLEQLHQGSSPAAPLGVSECNVKERREGGQVHQGAAEADRLLVEELKAELSQTKLELETTLKAQHKHLKELDTLRAEVSQKAAEVDAMNDHLTEERKRSRDLQWAMEKEKCRTGRNEESKREELEDLHLNLEEQKSRVAELTLILDQERQSSSQTSHQVEQERLSLHRRIQELQVQLETERAKVQEMSAALEREKELRMGVCTDSRPSDKAGERRRPEEEGSLLERLQRELDDKHAQVVHLLSQVEAQKLEVVRKEEQLTLGTQKSRRDQEALQEAQTQLETLRAQMSETQEQLEREMERRRNLEEEKERLEERLNQIRGQRGAEGHSAVWHTESTDRTKDWVLHQKSGNVPAGTSSSSPHMDITPAGHKILGKLHLISSKIRKMASKNSGRMTAEVDSEELSWIQSNVDEVINMLQQSPGLSSIPESVSLLAGGSPSSSNSLTERLLRQNAELTGFVSRLTEEKNDLRNHTLHLEEELRRYRQAGLGSGDSQFSSRRGVSKVDSTSLLLSQEREAWTRERVRLEKALHQSQAQVARLRGEIRTEILREISGPEADNAALKRMYGKYLRSESFRKALIYQKKYLLLLLGGFQECEEATLSLLTRMGGRPSITSLESLSQRRRGLMRFRSAVRVSIALSRMRFLVKRWHKATGMSSSASCSINKNGAGQTLGTDVRDSPYLHPGGVEMYRDRGSGGGGGGGVSSSRGRSGRESPRSASAVSSTHHRFHMAGDPGPLTCSHLQSYDPDRALTDYISRLEALQRRLGSVTSGASSYAQLHFGLRR